MQMIERVADLEALYDPVVPGALEKVLGHLSPLYEKWIGVSRFVVLSTVGPNGTDASPRGDSGSVVRVVDRHTLWLPDWRGNNRLDSLRNIVEDGRVSLMFLVPGSNNVVRVNGTAQLTADNNVTGQFQRGGKVPRTVIMVTVTEVYFQCAKALLRSRLWDSGDESDGVPSAGEFIGEVRTGFDTQAYDEGYAEYAKDRMW